VLRFALEDEDFLKHARQLKFDYALIDRFFVGPCFFLIAQAINVPYFSTGSPFDFWLGGLPTVPSVYLSCVPLDIDEGLHLFSYRLWHSIFLVFTETLTALGHHPASKYDGLLQKHAPTANSWQKVIAQSLVSFVTRELTLDNVQPRMPNVVTVPSVTFSDPTGILPPELNTLMTSEPANQHGVIVVSFGSMAKHLPLDIIENLAAAFAMLPNHVFVWNLKGISYDVTIPRNVHVLAWLPQNELLAHRNTKLFITHCGNNGYYESVYHRVPMVALPMWGDQPPNARLMQKKGFGITLDIGTFTSDELVQAIERVLSDVSYRQNVANV
jgi:glucuronosyltransferase